MLGLARKDNIKTGRQNVTRHEVLKQNVLGLNATEKKVLGQDCYILIVGIFPRASSKGAHGSQGDDSTYLA